MSVGSSAGAIIGITAAAPATFNAAGYAAATYTTIGEVTDLGEFGRDYTKIEHKPLAYRGTTKFKGGFDDGAIALQIGCDEKDAGQLLLETAAGSDANYYFKITRQDGTVHYFPAIVMNFKRNLGDRDKVTSVTSSLEITQVNGVGIVTVKPT